VAASAEVRGESLIVHVEGADKLWAMKSQLLIPLANVVSAARASEEAHSWLHGMRVGQSLPQLRPPDIGALAQLEL
jgi:hypothetical protein